MVLFYNAFALWKIFSFIIPKKMQLLPLDAFWLDWKFSSTLGIENKQGGIYDARLVVSPVIQTDSRKTSWQSGPGIYP
jgi:hypothetical protein